MGILDAIVLGMPRPAYTPTTKANEIRLNQDIRGTKRVSINRPRVIGMSTPQAAPLPGSGRNSGL